ncbi:hypothetical protein K431DRAFT_22191 [Polychaeton citri CBS 116435]|uniref:Vacuolar protein sorting-associated protein 51 homolog n=1 Tax=Polychaeton citri CBS 116435 TaxID=1314669 RepID=A0A9P4QC14_9PEZI|nr:hypothetical protein K431DRAFT_22191 [Polychaeton citri CBS 116435]
MASIASPRPSITLSSRRTSTSTETTERAATGSLRRNRAALRDYYNLKPPSDNAVATDAVSQAASGFEPIDLESELDKDGFDPQQYVANLLVSEGLEAIVSADAGLVSEIKGLDGEKKALVYDNYSKLISATDTIKKMRGNMEPLDPATTTLTPAIAHISETAAQLSRSLQQHVPGSDIASEPASSEVQKMEAVRWVVEAPARLSNLVKGGKKDKAYQQYSEVKPILDRWQHVKGVHELGQQCREIFE